MRIKTIFKERGEEVRQFPCSANGRLLMGKAEPQTAGVRVCPSAFLSYAQCMSLSASESCRLISLPLQLLVIVILDQGSSNRTSPEGSMGELKGCAGALPLFILYENNKPPITTTCLQKPYPLSRNLNRSTPTRYRHIFVVNQRGTLQRYNPLRCSRGNEPVLKEEKCFL